MWPGSLWASPQAGSREGLCVCPKALCHLDRSTPEEALDGSVGCAAERPCHHATLTSARPHPSHQPGLLCSGCRVSLGLGHHHVPLCTPSCNRQRQSSGRWMRPSPCSRRCCDPPVPTLSPQCSTNRDGSNKIFCQHFLLSVWCGQGCAEAWPGSSQEQQEGCRLQPGPGSWWAEGCVCLGLSLA